MNRFHFVHFASCISLFCLLIGCGGGGDDTASGSHILSNNHNNNGGSGSTNSSGGSGGDEMMPTLNIGGSSPVVPDCDPSMGLCVDAGEPGFCSDGEQDPGEGCDDGNATAGDGCTDACQVEANFVCPTPGSACVSTVKCGDKKITGAETCDDGNKVAGDGCDETCTPEPGWSCPIQGQDCVAAACGDTIIAGLEQCEDGDLVPVGGDGCDVNCQLEPGAPDAMGVWQGFVCNTAGSPCVATLCNDGTAEGSEPCDDGNQVVGDGCSPLCQVEPNCPPTGGACSSRCGDGIILPTDAEDCDDGNTTDGDGCSGACTTEAGYMCTLVEQALPPSITIPFVFRDFIAYPSGVIVAPQLAAMQRHPDFQNGCLGTTLENMTNDTLDTEGKPTNSLACALPAAPTCIPDVDYTDPGGDSCMDRDNGPGSTACGGQNGCNRSTHPSNYLPNHDLVDPFFFWYRDTPDVNQTLVVPTTLMGAAGVYSYNPGALFPFDAKGWVATGDELAGNAGHNFGFTSEVRYWFQFQGAEALTFNGDDDLFVYVNGKLGLAIGSKHGATMRTMVLNADGTATCAACTVASRALGIVPGNVYEIDIFHAERQAVASNFDLSITGFVKAKSECVSVCGDGVVTPDEECDAGADNDDTAYNGCTTTCTRGPSCGDGNVDVGHEACDDGVNLSSYGGCAPGCVDGPSCGDAVLQPDHEECDDGVFAAMYGGCAPDCKLGPRCGDRVVQHPPETCDDGNRVSGDGCKANCIKDGID